MKKVCFIPFFAVAPLFFAGCGDDVATTTVNETTVVESGISQLAAGEAFPECTEEESGEMLYTADSGKAYICTGKAWTPLHGESSADTVVVKDTLVLKDSLISKDTVICSKVDTVLVSNVDTLVIRDTLLQKDSVFFSQIDTVVLSNVDTVFFKDTLIIRDTLVGLNGESCTAEILADSSGYKIICGSDSVGVVLNGLDGSKGEKGDAGAAGANGKDGESCTVADSGNGVVAVQCAADTVKLYKALCANEPYDPEKSFCGNDGAKDFVETLCGGGIYDVTTQYCSNGTVATYGKLADLRDNQTYKTVVIGSQTWMAQNLNYRYTQGTAELDSSSFCYDDDASNCERYGRLYLWSAAMDSAAVFSVNGSGCGFGKTCSATEPVRGVCPAGWHLPNNDEWNALINAVGGQSVAGTKLKATSGWNSNGNGTDDYGFSALPGGDRYHLQRFDNVGQDAFFWSTTVYYSNIVTEPKYAYFIRLLDKQGSIVNEAREMNDAISVRCVKD